MEKLSPNEANHTAQKNLSTPNQDPITKKIFLHLYNHLSHFFLSLTTGDLKNNSH